MGLAEDIRILDGKVCCLARKIKNINLDGSSILIDTQDDVVSGSDSPVSSGAVFSAIQTLSYYQVVSTDSNYLILPGDEIILVDTATGDVNITLPSAVGRVINSKSKTITIKKTTPANTLNILTQNSQKVDGTTPPSLANLSSIVLISDNQNYYIL